MNISFSSPTMSISTYSGIKVSYGQEQSPKKDGNRDSVFISAGAQNMQSAFGESKMGGIIDGLMKQREQLQESKQKLIEKPLDNGGDLSSIKEELKIFDEQIRMMDEQVSQQMVENRQKALGLDDEDKPSNPSSRVESKTVEQVESEQLNTVVNLAAGMERIGKLDALKNKMQGEVNVINMEIKIDKETTISKRDRLADLHKNIEQIGNQVAEMLQSTNDELASQVKKPTVHTLENKESEEDNEDSPALKFASNEITDEPTENQFNLIA